MSSSSIGSPTRSSTLFPIPDQQRPWSRLHARSRSRLHGSHGRRNLSTEYTAPSTTTHDMSCSECAVPHTIWANEEIQMLAELIAEKSKLHWPPSTDHEFWTVISEALKDRGKNRSS